MLILISPAKTLDYESPLVTQKSSQPLFVESAQSLIEHMRAYSVQDIAGLMSLSDKLASLNVARYESWHPLHDAHNARPALLAFKGDVYTGLDATSFSEEEFDYAQSHLRILSGLYGVLRPLDLLQPYRLEMGTKFTKGDYKNLYEFWGERLTHYLNQELLAHPAPITLNLASNEYFKSVQAKQLKGQLISPEFKDLKNGQYKIISFYAKKARGLMARFVIQNKVEDPSQLKAFDLEGYYFSEKDSTDAKPVFLRDH